jgi:rare lipoprotein A
VACSLILCAGCASSVKYATRTPERERERAGREAEGSPAARDQGEIYASGFASYYGSEFHGRRTASGEIYDMNAMTAAHRMLPFGTMVEVENVENGREVIVRINDRGPFVPGRILDLSREAALRLGMMQTGTARVNLRLVETVKAE